MPRTSLADIAEDLVVAGYLGTKAMEPVSQKLYELEPEQDRAREDVARPGPRYRVAAEKISRLAGLHLDGPRLDRAALVLHYGLALSPLYAVLRRVTRLRPVTAGLGTGAAMSLITDELMTPPQPASPHRTGTTRWSLICAGSPRTWRSGSPSRRHRERVVPARTPP